MILKKGTEVYLSEVGHYNFFYPDRRNVVTLKEDVEAEVCSECGERYFHATTLDAIDRLLSKEHVVKANLNVEVVSLKEHGLTITST